jgi:hypothetical protein
VRVATSVLEAFVVTFGLDSRGFKSGANEVQDTSKRTRESVRRTFGEMEDQGKQLGQAFRTVRNEALGLFLAFTGASSITNFITGMLQSTAAADRLGQTLGMSTGRVVAWRQAMKEVGGSPGSADAAMQVMERAVQSYRLTGTTGMDADLLGLGINRADLAKKDPGSLLSKIAGVRGHMNGQEFAARLGRIGMPQDMVFFLQQGGERVQRLIAEYEKNSKVYEKQASEAEKLQKELADLNQNLMKALVPPVTKIAEILNRLFGDGKPRKLSDGSDQKLPWEDGFTSDLFKTRGGGPADDAITRYLMARGLSPEQALGIRAGIAAESHGDPNAVNPTSGAFGIGQWLGDRKKRLFARYGNKPNLQQQLEFLLSELHGGDSGGQAVLAQHDALRVLYAYVAKFMRPGAWGTAKDMTNGMFYLSSHRAPSNVNIGHITVHTQARDAHGVAAGLHHALRHRVAQADGGVAQ